MIDQYNWYATFFNGLATELWHLMVPEALTNKEVSFIRKVAGIDVGSLVLDMPSGSGRHAIALARDGVNVTAIDISPDNIERLQNAAGNSSVHAMCVDLFDYRAQMQFDAAICMGNSFSYFPYSGMVQFARQVYAALKPGGIFIINTGCVAENLLPKLKTNNTMVVGDITFNIHNMYLPEEAVLRTDMEFVRGEEREQKVAFHYLYTVQQLHDILAEAGFCQICFYGDTEMSEFSASSNEAYIVASR